MLSTHDTTNFSAWWENEAGTVDEALFLRRCSDHRRIDFARVREELFDAKRSRRGRLRWLESVDSVDKLVAILARPKQDLADFIDLYENSYREKEKFWKKLRLAGAMRENCDAEILRAALKFNLQSNAAFCVNTIIDWLYPAGIFKGDPYQYRINTPGTISPKNWSLTLPLSLEELLKHKATKEIRALIAYSKRI
jgi:4-alpha-glucanotransferase